VSFKHGSGRHAMSQVPRLGWVLQWKDRQMTMPISEGEGAWFAEESQQLWVRMTTGHTSVKGNIFHSLNTHQTSVTIGSVYGGRGRVGG
jgi:hypothetical protein